MPIVGLSDERRLPRAGKIHLGVKKESAKTKKLYPDAVDYFVVKADESTPQESADAFHKAYGKTPKKLKIVFPLNAPDLIFPHWLKQYTAAGLRCKGDGVKATRWVDGPDQTLVKKEIDCHKNPSECPYVKTQHGKPDCGPIANLQFLLPDVPIAGCWQVDTSSINGIIEINSTLEMLQFETKRLFGAAYISGIPMHLTLVPKQANPDGRRKTIHILHLDYTEGLQRLKDLRKAGALPGKPAEVPIEPINEDEVPKDLRPVELKATGPINYGGSTKIDPKEVEYPAIGPLKTSPDPEEPPEETPSVVDLDGVEEPDPIALATEREFFRLGIPEAKQSALRKAYKTPETLLTALQNTRITKERLAQLRAEGRKVNDNGYPLD